jgi:hypothetical protein
MRVITSLPALIFCCMYSRALSAAACSHKTTNPLFSHDQQISNDNKTTNSNCMPPCITFMSRLKEYPHLKNASAQAWEFKAQAMVLNAGDEELNAWKMFIGFQHREILVLANVFIWLFFST